MKEALNYIEQELTLQRFLIEKFYDELGKSDLNIAKMHWDAEIRMAKAQITQLENVKTLLTR